MSDKNHVYTKAAICVAVLVVVWLILKWRANAPQQVLGPEPELSPFQAPYFTTNPGVPDNYTITNGGMGPFNSNINVNVQSGQIKGLSNSYIPMFGLVGMTAVSG